MENVKGIANTAGKQPVIRHKLPFRKAFMRDLPKWLFMSPFIIGCSVFVLYPIIMSIVYSFADFDGLTIAYYGVFNYFEMFDFTVENGFNVGIGFGVWKSFGVTALYAIISIPLSMVLSYTLALALRRNIPGVKVVRLLFYLPVVLPGFVGGEIWMDILRYDVRNMGLLNNWLINGFGVANAFYQGKAATQLATNICCGLLGIGGGMIVWLAAFGNIPPTLYEAADIDGATYFQKLFKITLPMSTPIIFYNLICSIIGSLQIFDTYSYIGTGQNEGLYFISIRIYRTAFEQYNYGMACALSWVLFIVIGILTIIMFKSSKWVFYGE